jgi:hypothetical protein
VSRHKLPNKVGLLADGLSAPIVRTSALNPLDLEPLGANPDLCGSNMSDANIYREKAQVLSNAASVAADEQVRVTLLRLARSALRMATEMEASQCRGNPPVGTESDEGN